MKLRPADFENPYAAYSCELSSELTSPTLLQLGLQHRADGAAAPALAELDRLLRDDAVGHGVPVRVEAASFTDAAGYGNQMRLAYFRSREDHDAWWADPGVSSWWTGVPEDIGAFREVLTSSLDTMETSYSTPEARWGLAQLYPKRLDRHHSYNGAMRDRIAAAEDGGLAARVNGVGRAAGADGTLRSARLVLPEHACFIRTVQGWKDCPPEERDWFTERMWPVYERGVAFLRDNPEESGCLSARLVGLDDPEDSGIEAMTLAWFTSLEALEAWAHDHPTHHAILGEFGKLAEHFQGDVHVALGHEVYVVGAGDAEVEYVRCHPGTGLLPVIDPTSQLGESTLVSQGS
ncbi:phenylacetaldoxime dehydratase family protein [Nitriliruptor alkaliphilus]|uniref:phenylacetaldoxime dehydratase family protein n=1 Tax=Nitriliruptor alkaliphilus TaxID=427918 RepID=UPI0006965716|nr:phenylacetaldoxime dehydratase family protein [Nitriliruptor alkaliphilus]